MPAESTNTIILAIDSFKECLTSAQANSAAAEGIRASLPDAHIIQVPVSDGGEGWLEAFRASLSCSEIRLQAFDPLMRPITTSYLITGLTAIIEIARVSGLSLLQPSERNPLIATSYGVGQLIADAIRRGCTNIIIGLGGSATSDCGQGMLKALTDLHLTVEDITQRATITIATDVTAPLCGPSGAAHVFAPQKGATPQMVDQLETRARQFAVLSAHRMGHDHSNTPGAGAAGGLGYAFLQYLKAKRESGAQFLLNTIHFDDLLPAATLIITGEGSADRQTLMGKLPHIILQHARAHNIPVTLIAGRIADRDQLLTAGFHTVLCINPPQLPLSEALRPDIARSNIAATIKSIIDN